MWTLTPVDVLKYWTNLEDKPESNDALLVALTESAKVFIDYKVDDLDERVLTEPKLQTLLNTIGSNVIQRAYYTDYTGINSSSYATGPFSQSESRTDSKQKGLFLTPDEINLLTPADNGGSAGRMFKINFDQNMPNFSISSDNYSENGWGDYYGNHWY